MWGTEDSKSVHAHRVMTASTATPSDDVMLLYLSYTLAVLLLIGYLCYQFGGLFWKQSSLGAGSDENAFEENLRRPRSRSRSHSRRRYATRRGCSRCNSALLDE